MSSPVFPAPGPDFFGASAARRPVATSDDGPPIAFVPPVGPLVIGRALQTGRIILLGEAEGGAAVLSQAQPMEEVMKGVIDGDSRVALGDPTEDCKRVIRLCDAIECVERVMNNPTILAAAVARKIGDILVGPRFNLGKSLGEPIAKCMREKLLSQDSSRTLKQKFVYTRKP